MMHRATLQHLLEFLQKDLVLRPRPHGRAVPPRAQPGKVPAVAQEHARFAELWDERLVRVEEEQVVRLPREHAAGERAQLRGKARALLPGAGPRIMCFFVVRLY